MTWFYVDDALHTHPKSRSAGPAAMGLWVLAGSFCCQYGTEGFVPSWFTTQITNGSRLAHNLVRVGLWEKSERDGESGFQFHDWDHFQKSKIDIDADREANRERQRRFREKKRNERNAVTNTVTGPLVTDPLPPSRPT